MDEINRREWKYASFNPYFQLKSHNPKIQEALRISQQYNGGNGLGVEHFEEEPVVEKTNSNEDPTKTNESTTTDHISSDIVDIKTSSNTKVGDTTISTSDVSSSATKDTISGPKISDSGAPEVKMGSSTSKVKSSSDLFGSKSKAEPIAKTSEPVAKTSEPVSSTVKDNMTSLGEDPKTAQAKSDAVKSPEGKAKMKALDSTASDNAKSAKGTTETKESALKKAADFIKNNKLLVGALLVSAVVASIALANFEACNNQSGNITSITADPKGNGTIITFTPAISLTPHATFQIQGSDSTPSVDGPGQSFVKVISPNTISIATVVTKPGTKGTITFSSTFWDGMALETQSVVQGVGSVASTAISSTAEVAGKTISSVAESTGEAVGSVGGSVISSVFKAMGINTTYVKYALIAVAVIIVIVIIYKVYKMM